MYPALARLGPLLAVLAGSALGACDAPSAHPAQAASTAASTLRDETRPASAPRVLDGRFAVAYAPVQDSTYLRWQQEFRRGRFLEDMAEWLNEWVALPADVTLGFESCGEPNAFYRPERRHVALCYELVDDLEGALGDGGDQDAAQAVSDALLFTALHEVGHALVDVLQIPVTGREEDAVDQLAAVMLVDGTAEGSAAAVNGAAGLAAEEEVLDELAFADEHALGMQRFYNVLCLVYGQDPETHAAWVADGTLPPERAERCPEEFDQVADSWDRLLEPYLRAAAR